MTKLQPTPPFHKLQRGFTLIELLISMALGIVVIGASLVMYTSGSSANRIAQAQGQMNEDAQMALSVVTQELRQAGYNPVGAGGAQNNLNQGGWNLLGCDADFTANDTALMSGMTCKAAAAGANSSLAIAYEGDLYSGRNTVGPPALPMDCIGNGVAATAGYYIMQSRLYIANHTLTCRGGGDLTQSQILAENIDSMLITYGMTDPSKSTINPADATTKQVFGYLTADQINNPTDAQLQALTALQRWNKVAAARVCVVVSSEAAVLNDLKTSDNNPTYINCANTSTDVTDGKLRRAYRTTVLLRNHGVGHVDF